MHAVYITQNSFWYSTLLLPVIPFRKATNSDDLGDRLSTTDSIQHVDQISPNHWLLRPYMEAVSAELIYALCGRTYVNSQQKQFVNLTNCFSYLSLINNSLYL